MTRLAAIFAGGLAAACAHLSPASDPGPRYVTELVTIESDGWELAGTVRRDANAAAPLPAVLLLHKAAGTRSETDELAGELMRREIAVLQLDLRGHGGSTNLGAFIPEQRETRAINQEAHRDVGAAFAWLASADWSDAGRVAVLGASYSGERAARAYREDLAPAAAFVMMGPGDFSEDSVAAIDPSGVPWLFVRSENEIIYVRDVFDMLETGSATAELRVVAGDAHATEILAAHPDLNADIADWIADKLGAEQGVTRPTPSSP